MSQKKASKSDKVKEIEYAEYGIYRFGKLGESGIIRIKDGYVGIIHFEVTFSHSSIPDVWKEKLYNRQVRYFVISEFKVWTNPKWLEDAVAGKKGNLFTRFERFLYARQQRRRKNQ